MCLLPTSPGKKVKNTPCKIILCVFYICLGLVLDFNCLLGKLHRRQSIPPTELYFFVLFFNFFFVVLCVF